MSDTLHRHFVARLAEAQAAGHPDAETLTAFGERKISSQERQLVAGHLAACAECRDIVSLCAVEPRTGSRAYAACLAAAAAIILALAGTTSTMDSGIISWKQQPHLVRSDHSPQVSYAVAELKQPGAGIAWRVRNSVVECSLNFGKSWRPAKLGRPFDAEAVQFSGSDVLARSRSQELALSRDAGQHWTFLKPEKGR